MQKRFAAALSLNIWKHLPFFLEAVRAGSISKAAEALSTFEATTATTVARHLDALEAELDVKLLLRTVKGVTPTPIGEHVFRLVTEMERTWRRIETCSENDQLLTGPVRLWTSDGVGGYWLTPHLNVFHTLYPSITVEIVCSHDVPTTDRMEADLIVTYHEPTDPDVIVIATAMMIFKPFAARSYLQEYGIPETFADLYRHRICDHVQYPKHGEWQRWADLVRDHGYVTFRTNSSLTLGMVTLMGQGISMQPASISGREPSLVMLDIEGGYSASVQFWLTCHKSTKEIPRMRALIDYLKRTIFQRRSNDAGVRVLGLGDQLDSLSPPPVGDFIREQTRG